MSTTTVTLNEAAMFLTQYYPGIISEFSEEARLCRAMECMSGEVSVEVHEVSWMACRLWELLCSINCTNLDEYEQVYQRKNQVMLCLMQVHPPLMGSLELDQDEYASIVHYLTQGLRRVHFSSDAHGVLNNLLFLFKHSFTDAEPFSIVDREVFIEFLMELCWESGEVHIDHKKEEVPLFGKLYPSFFKFLTIHIFKVLAGFNLYSH